MNNPNSRSALAEGSQIGVYEIRELTGCDRLSLSYNAWNHHLNSLVWLREYFPLGLAERCADGMRIRVQSDRARQRYIKGLSLFLDEAEKLADIEDATLPRLLNALEFNDTGYLITSFEKGQSLESWLDSAYVFKPDELRVLFETLLAGLKVAHAHGLIHGMICPENILLRNKGGPMLINFSAGLLHLVTEHDRQSDILPEGYASAELYRPNSVPTPADDLYALAATLYRCITGHIPVSAEHRVKQLARGNPDPLSPWIPVPEREVSQPWIRALEWMLRPEAKDRPESVQQVDAFLSERAREAETRQRASGFGNTLTEWVRKGATGNRLVMTSVVVALIGLGLLSIPYLNAPEFSVTDAIPAGEKAISDRESEAIQEPSGSKVAQPGSKPIDTSERTARSDRDSESGDIHLEPPRSYTGEPASVGTVAGDLQGKKPQAGRTEALIEAKSEDPTSEISPAKPTVQPSPIETSRLDPVIAEHLAAAQKHLAELNLTTPVDNNAYAHYQAVLQLDPTNPEARSGIDRVLEHYVWLIESAVRRGKLRNARVYLARAETITSEWPLPNALRGRLEMARNALSASP